MKTNQNKNRKPKDRKTCVKGRKKNIYEKISSCTEDIDDYSNYQDPYSETKYHKNNTFLSGEINNEEISLVEEAEDSKFKSIYDPKLFVGNKYLDDYKCEICNNIVDEPKVLSCKCESIYCKKCLEEYQINNENKCPICRKKTVPKNPKNTFLTRLNELRMECDQCSWRGFYSQYKKHYSKEYGKKLVKFPNQDFPDELTINQIKEDKKGRHGYYTCPGCKQKLKNSEADIHHDTCPDLLVSCPNDCGSYVKRRDLALHNGECPSVKILCPYRQFGCGERFCRGMKEQKMKEKAHMHLYLLAKDHLELKNSINIYKKTMNEKLDKLLKIIKLSLKRDRTINENKNNNKTSSIMSNSSNKLSKSNEDDDENKSSEDDNTKDDNYEHDDNGDKNSDNKDIEMNANEDGKDDNKSIYILPKDSEDIFEAKDNKIISRNLDGYKNYCVLFDKECDIPFSTFGKVSTITIKIINPCDFLIFGICDSSLKDKIGSLFKSFKGNKKSMPIFAMNVDRTTYNFLKINEKEQKYEKGEKDGKEQADFGVISTIMCSYYPNNCDVEFSINGKKALYINDLQKQGISYLSPFLLISNNCGLETNFSYL